MQLRDYQADLLDRARAAMRDSRRVLVVAPTGSGKTVVFAHLAGRVAARGKRVCILVHRVELLDQTADTLKASGVSFDVIRAGACAIDGSATVTVASVQTLARRLDRHQYAAPDLLIIDECHHAVASTWLRIIDHWGDAYVMGFTATPERLDGTGLGDIFAQMVLGPTVAELIRSGHLADFVCFRPARGLVDTTKVKRRLGDFSAAELEDLMGGSAVVGDAVAEYRKHMHGRPAVLFSPSLRHAEYMAEQFRAAGYRSVSVDGTLTDDERRRRIRGLADGSVEVLTSCDLISEGLDVPAIQGIIDMKPTLSLAAHRQRVGRALRPKPDRSRAVILDLAGNTVRHGLPDQERTWVLSSERRRPGPPVAPVRLCEACFGYSDGSTPTCPYCDAPWPAPRPRRRMPKAKPGDLVEVSREHDAAPHLRLSGEAVRALARGCDSLRQLHALARRLGYSQGWAWRQWNVRNSKDSRSVDRAEIDAGIEARRAAGDNT